MDSPGYLTQNAGRAYPLREPAAGALPVPPPDFFLSLRLYLCAWQRVDVYLSRLDYDATADAYTLTFGGVSDSAVLLVGTAPRRLGGAPRVGLGVVIGSGARLAVFVPGAAWDAPALFGGGGTGSWTVSYAASAAQLEPSDCVPGPATLRQLCVDAEVPAADPPLDVVLSLSAGAGVRFTPGRSSLSLGTPVYPVPAPAVVTLEAGTGLGEAPPPPAAAPLYVCSLNGQAPDENGAFLLGAQDCLRATQPVVAGAGGAPSTLLPNTLQLSNDCGPCCGCADYRRVARAIARRGAKLADLCSGTAAALADAVARYAALAAALDARRPPPVRTENLFAQSGALHFTVRDAVEIPLFLYVALDWQSAAAPPALTLGNSSSTVVYLGETNGAAVTFESLVAADRATLPALAATPYDPPAARAFPFTGADANAGWVFRVNARDAAGGLVPLAPGAGVRIDFTAASSGAADPFAAPAAAGLVVILRALSAQGSGLTYPANGFTSRLDLVAGDPSAAGGSAGAGYVGVPPAAS